MDQKICKSCEQSLPVEDFYGQRKRGKVNGQIWKYRDSFCKRCRAKATFERRSELKRQAVEYLGGRCVACGIVDDPVIYDFHHRDPSKKDFSIGSRTNKTLDALKSELDKCDLLCAHCHRKGYYHRPGNGS